MLARFTIQDFEIQSVGARFEANRGQATLGVLRIPGQLSSKTGNGVTGTKDNLPDDAFDQALELMAITVYCGVAYIDVEIEWVYR